jgi:hypothetical protein
MHINPFIENDRALMLEAVEPSQFDILIITWFGDTLSKGQTFLTFFYSRRFYEKQHKVRILYCISGIEFSINFFVGERGS